jgi:hypothetical protein
MLKWRDELTVVFSTLPIYCTVHVYARSIRIVEKGEGISDLLTFHLSFALIKYQRRQKLCVLVTLRKEV